MGVQASNYSPNDNAQWRTSFTFSVNQLNLTPATSTSPALKLVSNGNKITTTFTKPSSGNTVNVSTKVGGTILCGNTPYTTTANVSFQLWRGRIMVPNTLKVDGISPSVPCISSSNISWPILQNTDGVNISQIISLTFTVSCGMGEESYFYNGDFTITYPSNYTYESSLPVFPMGTFKISHLNKNGTIDTNTSLNTGSQALISMNRDFKLNLVSKPPELATCVANYGGSSVNYFQ